MSFILDALKKSENDRQEQAEAEFATVPSSPGPLAAPSWLWVLGGLLPGTHESVAFVLDSFTYLTSAALVSTLPIMAHKLSEQRKRRGRMDVMAPLRDLRAHQKTPIAPRSRRGPQFHPRSGRPR